MSLFRLAIKNIEGSAFRSLAVLACALVVSGFALSTTLIIRGAESSLAQANQRLGADILLVPKGTAKTASSALIIGKPNAAWVPVANADKAARVPGVQTVSPQLYLGTVANSPYCVAADMYVVALDPQTDFSVTAWLPRPLSRPLGRGEAVGGTFVTAGSDSNRIEVYGTRLNLLGNLEPIGIGLDQTLFVTLETAQDMIGRVGAGSKPLASSTEMMSAALVRLQTGYAVPNVAMRIQQVAPEVTAIDSPDLLQAQRKQMAGLTNTVMAVLAVALVLSIAAIYLIFSMAVTERRWQIGVLRALGATRRSVFFSLLLEANLLGLVGGVIGLTLASLLLYQFRDRLIQALQIPFLLPAPAFLILLFLLALVAVAASVTLSALFPALSISRQEPSLAMRE